MDQIKLAGEFSNESRLQGEEGKAPDQDLRLLRDLELLQVGGGDLVPIW